MTPDANRTVLVVAAALIDQEGRVLVQQRPADKQHGGLWEFPGGKVEPSETPEDALVRELREELGIEVAPTALAPLGFSTGLGIVLLLYRCANWSGQPVAQEGAALAWLMPAELDTLAMPPADLPLIASLRAPSRS